MASQPSSPSPFGSRPTPSSSTPSAFQPPATTHAPHVPHPLSARLPIGVGGSNTSGSGSLPSSLPSTLPSRLNTVSPPPTPTSPILRSTSPPISGSASNTRLRPSPLLGTTPLPGNRSSSTHAGGILPPASFFRPTGSNSAGRARGQSITSPASPGGSVVPTSLPFKSTSSPSGERTSALPTTMGGLTPGKKLPIGEVRGSNMGSLSKAPLLPFSGSSSAPAPTSAIAGVRGSFERLFWKRSSSGAGGDGGNGAHRDEEAEVGSIGKRSSKRISVDDLGDGPSGGGVVMEMGRIAEFSQLEVGEGWKERNRSRVEDVHEDEEEIDAEGHVRERRNSFLEREQMGKDGFAQSSNYQRQQGSQGDFLDVDTRVEPEPHTATTDTMTESVHKPPIPRIETHPSENEAHGTPVSRHARFAPSPPRSAPTQQSNNDAQAKQSSPSWSIFHWRRNPIPIPSYLIPVFSGKNSKTLRNYKFHPSRNRYLFKGHLITGGDSAWPFVGALTVVLGIAGVWFGSTCVWWWRRGDGGQAVAGVGAYLCLLTITSMLMTATRDPGILPRDLDPDPPYPQTTTTASDSSPPVPLPRDLRVRNGTVRVKYCVTCKTYRPPRSSHCKMCDNCVDGCDHHCQWVNNCVGRRNYTYFITFVVTASITLLLVLVTAFLHIYYLTQDEGYNVRGALKHAPGSAVALGMGIVVIWPLLALTLYHVRLLLLNITTIEQVRNQAHRKLTKSPTPPNPFTTGRWYRNVAYLVCRPAGYSWVDLSGVALHDSRKVNPGFVVSQVGGSGGRTSESTRDDGEGERWKRSGEFSAR